MGQTNSKSSQSDPLSDIGFTPPIREETDLADKEEYATMLMVRDRQNIVERAADCHEPLKMFDKEGYDTYNYEREELPIDEQGFVVSFDWQDDDGIKQFFDKYGVVVVGNILSDKECEKGVDQVWDFLERHHQGLNRNNPATWNNWPSLMRMGILGNTFVLSAQFWENRQNPRVYHVFSKLLGSEQLISGAGRANLIRPTLSVPWPADVPLSPTDEVVSTSEEERDGKKWIRVNKPEWKTMENWLHWDMNPFTTRTTTFGFTETDWKKNRGYDRPKVQCTLSFVDCRTEDGGFHCVPGFHKHIRSWARANYDAEKPISHETTVNVPSTDPIRNDIQKVSARKGSLIIWSSCLPHGTYPNQSDRPRIIQYIHIADYNDPSISHLFVNPDLFPPAAEFEPSPLGRKLFGLDPWAK